MTDPWKLPMNGLGCDYCDQHAVGGCYGFHACPDHMNQAAKDARDAQAANRHLHIRSAFSRCEVCGEFGVYNASVKSA